MSASFVEAAAGYRIDQIESAVRWKGWSPDDVILFPFTDESAMLEHKVTKCRIRLDKLMADFGKSISAIADEIALRCTPDMYWDAVREECDFSTGGEFDCVKLDILTDAVLKRVSDRAKAGGA